MPEFLNLRNIIGFYRSLKSSKNIWGCVLSSGNKCSSTIVYHYFWQVYLREENKIDQTWCTYSSKGVHLALFCYFKMQMYFHNNFVIFYTDSNVIFNPSKHTLKYNFDFSRARAIAPCQLYEHYRDNQLSAMFPVAKPVWYPPYGFEEAVLPLTMNFIECISIIAREVSTNFLSTLKWLP